MLPWSHTFINNEGHIHACCMAENYGKGAVDSSDKPVVVDQKEALKKSWHSKYFRSLRKKMLSGERPEECFRCFNDEDSGLRSYRQNSNFHHVKRHGFFSVMKMKSVKPPHQVSFIDLRLGNLCNLKCRMCHPVASKKWIDEWTVLFKKSLSEDRKKQLRDMDWYESPDFWSQFEEGLPYINRIHLAGGEPLIIRQTFDFLKKVVASGYSKQIDITYNTNMTVLPQAVYEFWPQFKSVQVMASLDGLDQINSYIRHPADWSKIVEHMDLLVKDQKQLRLKPVSIVHTVQMMNVHHLVEFCEWFHKHYPTFNQNIKLNLLTSPSCYSIQALPRIEKERLSHELDAYQKKLSRNLKTLFMAQDLKGVIQFMMNKDTEFELEEMKRRTRLLDETRKESLQEAIPQLAQLI